MLGYQKIDARVGYCKGMSSGPSSPATPGSSITQLRFLMIRTGASIFVNHPRGHNEGGEAKKEAFIRFA